MKGLVAAVFVLFLLAAPVSHAGTITLVGSTVDTLVGGSALPIGSAVGSDMVSVEGSGDILAEVTNQAYTGDNGLYVYLYQVNNTGTMALEMFTLWPFAGADDYTEMGWLTDDPAPTGFDVGGQLPEDTGFISTEPVGAVISFYYSKRYGNEIAVGEKSAVMYVASDLPPDIINANVIDGAVGTGEVVGAVPEPATAIYLILGGLSLLGFYRRR